MNLSLIFDKVLRVRNLRQRYKHNWIKKEIEINFGRESKKCGIRQFGY